MIKIQEKRKRHIYVKRKKCKNDKLILWGKEKKEKRSVERKKERKDTKNEKKINKRIKREKREIVRTNKQPISIDIFITFIWIHTFLSLQKKNNFLWVSY